jgi:hypothetical protein
MFGCLASKAVVPRLCRHVSAIVPVIGCAIANRHRADSDDPRVTIVPQHRTMTLLEEAGFINHNPTKNYIKGGQVLGGQTTRS